MEITTFLLNFHWVKPGGFLPVNLQHIGIRIFPVNKDVRYDQPGKRWSKDFSAKIAVDFI